jgi:transcriptional regulator of heat shock response
MLELSRRHAEDVTVTIGAEHPHRRLGGIDRVGSRRAGSSAPVRGVVGPTAMDYVGVMASVVPSHRL